MSWGGLFLCSGNTFVPIARGSSSRTRPVMRVAGGATKIQANQTSVMHSRIFTDVSGAVLSEETSSFCFCRSALAGLG